MPDPTPARRRHPLTQAFWLAFLVASLAYAWYSFYVPANRIDWAADVATARERAAASDKPVLLFVTGAWCVPCRIMKREVFADDEVVAAVHAGFVPVLLDVDDADDAAALARYGAGGTPRTIVTDAQGEVLRDRGGRMTKDAFLAWLDHVLRHGADDA